MPVCFHPFVVHFLSWEEGDFVSLLSVYPGGEGFNNYHAGIILGQDITDAGRRYK